MLIITTVGENLGGGPLYKHTKELRCSSASLAASLLIELQEMRPTADALLSTEKISHGNVCHITKKTQCHTHKYKTNITIQYSRDDCAAPVI